MVTAPANTGITAINKKAVINHVHTNNGISIIFMAGARILKIVAIMLIAPIMDEIPNKCTEKIANGNALPTVIGCKTKGGYKVQPPLGAPPSINRVLANNKTPATNIQKLILFMRGNAISAAPIIKGICQLANPTKAGITAPNTMTRACMVVIELKNAGSTNCNPGSNNSARITIAIAPPTKNISKANNKYNVPMSL